MARANERLIEVLRVTATRLESGAAYKWSHYGHCNCGHLAQTVTKLSPKELYEAAFERPGDWGQQAREFCPSSGYALDDVFAALFELGMEPEDVQRLERLDDGQVLRRIGVSSLSYTSREDVVRYLRGWADLMEGALPGRGRADVDVEELIAAE